MKRKADVSQVFVYIISGIIMVAVLGFGVRSIFVITNDAKQIKCTNSIEDLKERLYNDRSYGVVDSDPVSIDCEYAEICFIDIGDDVSPDITVGDGDLIIYDSWESKAKQNVFLKNTIAEGFYYIENMKVDSNGDEPGGLSFICRKLDGGSVGVNFKGLGNNVMVFEKPTYSGEPMD